MKKNKCESKFQPSSPLPGSPSTVVTKKFNYILNTSSFTVELIRASMFLYELTPTTWMPSPPVVATTLLEDLRFASSFWVLNSWILFSSFSFSTLIISFVCWVYVKTCQLEEKKQVAKHDSSNSWNKQKKKKQTNKNYLVNKWLHLTQ